MILLVLKEKHHEFYKNFTDLIFLNCVGVEYIVSDKIFETLPADEQKLWHSHAYEVQFVDSITP